jgi:predicted GNAT superfamily acetyltransferase
LVDDEGITHDVSLDTPTLRVHIPVDYLRLRTAESALASAWRDSIADGFERAFASGYVAVDFDKGGCYYVLERRPV